MCVCVRERGNVCVLEREREREGERERGRENVCVCDKRRSPILCGYEAEDRRSSESHLCETLLNTHTHTHRSICRGCRVGLHRLVGFTSGIRCFSL